LAQRNNDFELTALHRRRTNPGRPTPVRPAMSRRHRGRSRHAQGRGNDVLRSPAQVDPRPETPRPAIDPGPAIEAQRTQFHAAAPVDVHQNGNGHLSHPAEAGDANGAARAGCTAPQLRRFIKSRPYVPMHELRRRFGINGAEDEVSPLPIDNARVYVGLPERECRLLGELVRGGEVGYELSLDPRTPIVVGVYPMRPVPRA
jgi:hypothetical protein